MPYWRIYFHLVWATKNREPLIDEAVERAVKQSVKSTCQRLQVAEHGSGFKPDHVHLAVSIPPSQSVSDVVKALKGASSRAVGLQANGESNFYWQKEYGVVTFGERQLPTVIAYFQNQKRHHANNELYQSLERIEDDS